MNAKLSYIIAFILILIAASNDGHAYGLADYMPDSTSYMVNSNGDVNTVFQIKTTNRFRSFMPCPGKTKILRKSFLTASGWKSNTFSILAFCKNGTVAEIGGMNKNSKSANYYKKNGKHEGLLWSNKQGFNTPYRAVTIRDSDKKSFSKTSLIGKYEQLTVNGIEYKDVIKIQMLHGTDNDKMVFCPGVKKVTGYNSYAMEWTLVKGVGIVAHNVPYIESGKFFGLPNCFGSNYGHNLNKYKQLTGH
jgi:hypothetical protein